MAAPRLPPSALAIERTSNVHWLRRDRGELWFEGRGFEPDAGGAPSWSRIASDAAWIASAGDAIALLGGDTIAAFDGVVVRPLFAAPGLAAALAGARAALVDPVRRCAYVAGPDAIVAYGADAPRPLAPLAAVVLALSNDRRRLYAATATAIACIATDDGTVNEVAALPDGTALTALATSPAGLVGTCVGARTAALVGVNLRHPSCRVLRALPAELAGAPVVADHEGTLTLAAPDRLYRSGLDGRDLEVCFEPARAS